MRIDFGASAEFPYGIPWAAMSKAELKRRVNSPADFTTLERLEAVALLRMTPKTNEAEFTRGELQAILGVSRTTLHDAITRAVARRSLAPGSTSRCLLVPGGVAQVGKGTATKAVIVTAAPFDGVRDRTPKCPGSPKMFGIFVRFVGKTEQHVRQNYRIMLHRN